MRKQIKFRNRLINVNHYIYHSFNNKHAFMINIAQCFNVFLQENMLLNYFRFAYNIRQII